MYRPSRSPGAAIFDEALSPTTSTRRAAAGASGTPRTLSRLRSEGSHQSRSARIVPRMARDETAAVRSARRVVVAHKLAARRPVERVFGMKADEGRFSPVSAPRRTTTAPRRTPRRTPVRSAGRSGTRPKVRAVVFGQRAPGTPVTRAINPAAKERARSAAKARPAPHNAFERMYEEGRHHQALRRDAYDPLAPTEEDLLELNREEAKLRALADREFEALFGGAAADGGGEAEEECSESSSG